MSDRTRPSVRTACRSSRSTGTARPSRAAFRLLVAGVAAALLVGAPAGTAAASSDQSPHVPTVPTGPVGDIVDDILPGTNGEGVWP
jgi:hypothetical protein